MGRTLFNQTCYNSKIVLVPLNSAGSWSPPSTTRWLAPFARRMNQRQHKFEPKVFMSHTTSRTNLSFCEGTRYLTHSAHKFNFHTLVNYVLPAVKSACPCQIAFLDKRQSLCQSPPFICLSLDKPHDWDRYLKTVACSTGKIRFSFSHSLYFFILRHILSSGSCQHSNLLHSFRTESSPSFSHLQLSTYSTFIRSWWK